jgi:hypothetical protein
MFSSDNCRFALLFFALLSLSVNAETVRGAQRELQNSGTTPSVIIGNAVNYAILAKSGISTVPSSTITGNIGVSPIAATAMTGFGFTADPGGQFSTSTQLTGLNKAYSADCGGKTAVALTAAVTDMEAAYTDAAGRTTSFEKLNLGNGVLGSDTTLVLTTGVYTFGSSVAIAAEGVTFKGSATDIFIIQIAGDLTVEKVSNVEVSLDGGALAENIFWQVAGKVVVKAGAEMKGILLVKTAVTFLANSSLEGRVLTQTRCNLDQATINSV